MSIPVTDMLVWDNHGCMPLRADDRRFLPQLARYREAGVDVVTLNVGFDGVPWQNTAPVAKAFRQFVEDNPTDYLMIDSVHDIDVARQTGRLGVTFDIEGGSALNGEVERLQGYYELGVRWMLIAYNHNNLLGGGCQDDDTGLTDFGRQVLDEMNRLGMVPCCSHTGHQTASEVLDYCSTPVIFSHSNPSGLVDHKRNIPDSLIKGCAESGGVIGINGIGLFLGDNNISADNIVRHIDYVASLVGVEHVGLSLDYAFDTEELDEYVAAHPELFPADEGYNAGIAMAPPEVVPDIAETLSQLGYSDTDLRLIMGENHLRIARQIWK